jgi:membrane fusion protein (multidrug efflux system)
MIKNKARLCLSALVAASFFVEASCGRQAVKAPAGPEVRVVRPHEGAVGRTVTLPGNVLAYQQATLYAKVAGYLKTITVDKGDHVKQGDVLADIEVPELIADRAKFKADLEVMEIDYRRNVEARKKAPELVVAQTVDNAKGKYDIARAELERIDTLLGYAKITAPFSGVITKRFVDPGAFIPAATSGSAAETAAIVTIADFDTVRVQVALPEQEAPFIKDGLAVTVTIPELPGRKFDATITRYAHCIDPATRTMLIESEISNSSGDLVPGMYALVSIEVERHENTLVIPADALVTEKTKTSVFALDQNKAKKVPVKVGFNDGASVEILDGIKPDQSVILIDKLILNDGQPVRPTANK